MNKSPIASSHFVTHKFVFKTQAVFVQYAIIVNNDGTIEAAAQAQTTGLQIFDITHEPNVRARLIWRINASAEKFIA